MAVTATTTLSASSSGATIVHQNGGTLATQQPATGTTATTTTTTTTTTATKLEQKPVECNLCHRKFKNIPALNGHMRLHGGYFKKDSEAKKCDKKENTGPPLQTASVGVRALIEEKIINKRSKDLKVRQSRFLNTYLSVCVCVRALCCASIAIDRFAEENVRALVLLRKADCIPKGVGY